MDRRPGSLAWLAVLWMVGGATSGCSGDGSPADAGPGPGTVVATLPPDVTAIALAGDAGLLHVVGGRTHDDGGVELFIFRVSGGVAEPEPIASGLEYWTDYFESYDITLGTRFDVLPGAAYLFGWQGVTVVPFDGSPPRFLFRPQTQPDGGAFPPLPDGGIAASVEIYPEAFQLEPDGSVLVAYGGFHAETCEIGRFDLSGAWQTLATLPETCDFLPLLLANPASLHATTRSSLWRIDRATAAPTELLFGLQGAGDWNSIYQLASTDDALVFNRLVGQGAELDRLEPDGGLQRLETFDPTEPYLIALAAQGPSIYELSAAALRRRLPSGGFEVLAQSAPNGVLGLPGLRFVRLVLGDAGVYLTYLEATDAGIRSTLRLVPR